MNVAFHGTMYCECGYAMQCFGQAYSKQTVGCTNPQCKNHGKRFKLPTHELVEVVKEEIADRP